MAYNAQLSVVCPQLAGTAKIAEVHHTHYSIYEKLRYTSLNPEALTYPKAMKFQKVLFRGQVPMKLSKEAVWHITDSVC